MDYEKELQVALEAATIAGEYLRNAYEAFTPIPNAPASISTIADRESQEKILAHLATAFPNDALCAEEQAPALQRSTAKSKRLWIVDPIDGTRGFAMKNGEFSVMIGLAVEGEVVVGVVLEPAKWRVTFAQKGGGCWARTESHAAIPARVTETSTLNESTLVQSHSKTGQTSWPVKVIAPRNVVETYSAGVKLAMVARGEVDMYVNTYANFSDWDICAGHLLVTEAGGQVTELSGSAIRYGTPGYSQQGGLVATNGVLHEAVVAALRRREH